MNPAYNAWADERLVDFLRTMPTRPPQVEGILAHLVVAGETWLARLGGASPTPDLWPEMPFEEAVLRLSAVDARLREPVSEGIVRYRNSTGAEFENAPVEILAHVLNHATYHRGEIAGLLLASGLEPPTLDLIAYLRELRANTLGV